MKNSIFTVLFLTVFSPLVCMEVVPCIPPVLPQVLSYCDPSDIGSLLSVNKGFKKMMCSEVGLAYAADIRDKKLFLTLLQKQDRQEQKESHAFLVKMRYLLIELSEDEDSTEMEEEEHLLSLEDASLEEYMKAYRYEVESLDLSDRIRSALAEYNPLLTDAIQTDYKKTIEKYACVRSLNNQRNALISPLDWAILISNKAS